MIVGSTSARAAAAQAMTVIFLAPDADTAFQVKCPA
jgi:hypothetical protein